MKCHAGAGHGPALATHPFGAICAQCFARLVGVVHRETKQWTEPESYVAIVPGRVEK